MDRWFLCLLSMLCLPFATQCSADDAIDYFESRVRPVLVEHCYQCHAADKQEGGLRLDWQGGWSAGGDNGPAIVPGDPDASRLVQAIRYQDANLQMPPNQRLTEQQIADLESWVRQGAQDPRSQQPQAAESAKARLLWALSPVQNPIPPATSGGSNSIDAFIHERFASNHLDAGPMADRRTLIRRATIGLTGLLPSYDEVIAFENDPSPDAYERLIDRLLSSPRYGEHWARHWLDIARYSDTKGYVYAREEKRWVHAAAYRDWVIQSLNSDMPYDQFIALQVAADQLAGSESDDLAAMGFLTLGRRFLGVTHDIYDDRIDVLTRGVLGLTVACARCHDHKYDPIPTRDYYALYGLFQSSAEKLVYQCKTTDQAYLDELERRQNALQAAMQKQRDAHMQRALQRIDRYLLAQLELENYPEEVFSQILDDDDLNPVLVRKWQAFLARDKDSSAPVFARWHERRDSQASIDELKAIAAELRDTFVSIDRQWKEQLASNANLTRLTDDHAEQLRQVIHGEQSPCYIPDEHIANIELYFTNAAVVELWKHQGEVDRWLLERSDQVKVASVLVDRNQPQRARVFVRGNPTNKGAAVPRRNLSLLGGSDDQPFSTGSGRLELARALTDPANPFTPRVIANRIWMHHFGQGLVTTPSDFGSRAEPPTHPELLDWLASRLIKHRWSLKQLHRDILLSSTYRQDSKRRSASTGLSEEPGGTDKDPANHWLSRFTPHRLSFEELRDNWLRVGDDLSNTIGGKPMSLFDATNQRRTIYAFVDRESLAPVLRVFDFANPDLSIPKRNETTVPQQALFGMNHPFAISRAKRLAAELESRNDRQFIEGIYARMFQRRPTDTEMHKALEFLAADETSLPTSDTKPSEWSYGFGAIDADQSKLTGFASLPYFTQSAWQGGPTFPDANLGWLQLTALGGHPGNDLAHAISRRWTAPQPGFYSIQSQISHEPDVSDGIRAAIIVNSSRPLARVSLRHTTMRMDVESVELKKGDTIDFVVDIGKELNSDQFLWAPRIELRRPNGSEAAPRAGVPKVESATNWDATKDFAGPLVEPLTPRQQLAQVLLLTNEFLFVD